MSSESEALTGDTDASGQDDSAVIRELRKQLKEAKAKQVDPQAIREQVLNEVKREATATELMDKAGFPGLAEVFNERVDGELNEQAAHDFLSSLKLTTEEGTQEQAQPATPEQQIAEVAQVAGAGNQFGEARIANDDAFGKRILEATNSHELAELLKDAPFTQQ